MYWTLDAFFKLAQTCVLSKALLASDWIRAFVAKRTAFLARLGCLIEEKLRLTGYASIVRGETYVFTCAFQARVSIGALVTVL